MRLEVSRRLKAEWENGREYYAYHGKELMCRPTDAASFPSGEFLQWHNENTFKA
jgi:putative restriction endonuclease